METGIWAGSVVKVGEIIQKVYRDTLGQVLQDVVIIEDMVRRKNRRVRLPSDLEAIILIFEIWNGDLRSLQKLPKKTWIYLLLSPELFGLTFISQVF